MPLPEEMVPSSQEQLSSSEQEPDPEVSFLNSDHPNKFQECSCQPYIEGPKLDWTGKDGLYYRFFKVALEI